MATFQFRSRSFISLQNHEETSSSCHSSPNLLGYNHLKDLLCHGLKMRRNFGRKELASRGCSCSSSGERSCISEEDRRFLEVLGEAYPHIFLQRGNTFVVFLSGELVHSTHLDHLLRVSLSAFLEFAALMK